MSSANAKVAQAEARLVQAKQNFARVKPLLAEQAVSQKDVDDAVARMKAARARGDVAVNMPAFPQSAEHFNKSESLMQALMGDPAGARQGQPP